MDYILLVGYLRGDVRPAHQDRPILSQRIRIVPEVHPLGIARHVDCLGDERFQSRHSCLHGESQLNSG